MALFERDQLPARSTLSRFLAALSAEPVAALRTLFLDDPSSPFLLAVPQFFLSSAVSAITRGGSGSLGVTRFVHWLTCAQILS